MDIYKTDDEQVEALKKWWQENGKSAIFGVVLGLMAIFGWREWQDYRVERSAAASQLYQQMVLASRDADAATLARSAEEISGAYKDTAYALFARLALAKIAVGEGDYEKAVTDLRWALDQSPDPNLAHIIRLRLVRALIAKSEFDEASEVLNSVKDRGKFAVSYLALQADILRLQDNPEAAREGYRKALAMAREAGANTTVLEMKLDDLGGSEAE